MSSQPPQPDYAGLQVLPCSDPEFIAPPPPPRPGKRNVCGLRWGIFWAIIVVAAVVIIASVVGGVVGSRNTRSPAPVADNDSTPTSSGATPNPTTPQHNTALTVPVLMDNTSAADTYIVVYQSVSQELYFSRVTLGGSSDMPAPVGSEFKTKPGTPLAALAFTDGSGSTKPTASDLHIYIFYLDNSSYLADAVLTNRTWKPGTLRLRNIPPHAASKLAATIWLGGTLPSPWIYYQEDTGYIRELGLSTNGRWIEGNYGSTIDLRVSPGSGLATCYDIDEKGYQRLKVYAQVSDGAIVSRDYTEEGGKGWNDYYPVYQAGKNVQDISVVPKRNNMTAEEMTLFFVEEGGGLQELGWTKAKGWAKVAEYVIEESGGKVGAALDTEGVMRVYLQEGNGTVIKEATVGRDSKWLSPGAGIEGTLVANERYETWKETVEEREIHKETTRTRKLVERHR
ncbi:hypothetical protein BDD12DRAFT_807559 [Trichophaea hybrida]|nr:hypothetical protein BDD12DRAFT_807559 [Trichophaea hybrida]